MILHCYVSHIDQVFASQIVTPLSSHNTSKNSIINHNNSYNNIGK